MKSAKPLIAVIDYGMGNLRSVQKALEQVGADARVTDSPALVRKAQGVVLPGVGAFGQAVRRLHAKRLWKPLQETLRSEKPFLGICLGYQLLFEKSAETPGVRGLGHFKGAVKRFRFPKASRNKVPHMGWNTLQLKTKRSVPLLKGIGSKDYFYFVHSFYPAPADRSLVTATTAYGKPFTSVVAQRQLFACQFHPEKSGDQGQQLLRNFVSQVKAC